MLHQLVLNCLSSKTNLVFSQTLYMPFRERYAVITPSIFFKRPFSKSYSLTKAKFYLANPSDPAKTEKIHGPITSEQEINPVQFPHPSNATFKFPPPRHHAQSNAQGMPGGGGGMLKFRIDRRIIRAFDPCTVKHVLNIPSFLVSSPSLKFTNFLPVPVFKYHIVVNVTAYSCKCISCGIALILCISHGSFSLSFMIRQSTLSLTPSGLMMSFSQMALCL